MGPLNQGMMRGQELLEMGQELLGLQARGQEVVGPPVVEVLGEGLDLHPASRSPKPYRRAVPGRALESSHHLYSHSGAPGGAPDPPPRPSIHPPLWGR